MRGLVDLGQRSWFQIVFGSLKDAQPISYQRNIGGLSAPFDSLGMYDST